MSKQIHEACMKKKIIVVIIIIITNIEVFKFVFVLHV